MFTLVIFLDKLLCSNSNITSLHVINFNRNLELERYLTDVFEYKSIKRSKGAINYRISGLKMHGIMEKPLLNDILYNETFPGSNLLFKCILSAKYIFACSSNENNLVNKIVLCGDSYKVITGFYTSVCENDDIPDNLLFCIYDLVVEKICGINFKFSLNENIDETFENRIDIFVNLIIMFFNINSLFFEKSVNIEYLKFFNCYTEIKIILEKPQIDSQRIFILIAKMTDILSLKIIPSILCIFKFDFTPCLDWVELFRRQIFVAQQNSRYFNSNWSINLEKIEEKTFLNDILVSYKIDVEAVCSYNIFKLKALIYNNMFVSTKEMPNLNYFNEYFVKPKIHFNLENEIFKSEYLNKRVRELIFEELFFDQITFALNLEDTLFEIVHLISKMEVLKNYFQKYFDEDVVIEFNNCRKSLKSNELSNSLIFLLEYFDF